MPYPQEVGCGISFNLIRMAALAESFIFLNFYVMPDNCCVDNMYMMMIISNIALESLKSNPVRLYDKLDI